MSLFIELRKRTESTAVRIKIINRARTWLLNLSILRISSLKGAISFLLELEGSRIPLTKKKIVNKPKVPKKRSPYQRDLGMSKNKESIYWTKSMQAPPSSWLLL